MNRSFYKIFKDAFIGRIRESDGTSQKKYCQQHGLSYSHFVTARSKLRSSRDLESRLRNNHFAEVVPAAQPTKHNPEPDVPLKCVTIITAKGSKIELPLSIDSAVLATLLASLGPSL